MPSRNRLLLLFALLAVAVLLVVAVLGGGSIPSAPSSEGPARSWGSFPPGLAAYDAADGYDVWLMLDGSTWTYAHGDWSNITTDAGVPVHMEGNSRLVYDAQDRYLLLYGGETGFPIARTLADTWTFQAGRWTNLTGSVRDAPPPMVLGMMAYDSEDKVVVLFGGSLSNESAYSPFGPATNTTWTYTAGAWTNATVPGPPPLGGSFGPSLDAAMMDDPADGYVLYYLELGYLRSPFPVMWTYAGGVWTNRTVAFSPAPALFLFDVFAYDSTSRTVVVLSSCASTPGFSCGDRPATVEFSGGSWRFVGLAPTFRESNGFVDDPWDGGVMFVGGCCWADFSGLSLFWQNVWVYAHGTWTESDPWGGGAPSWTQNDGSWLALSIAVATAVSVVSIARKSVLFRR